AGSAVTLTVGARTESGIEIEPVSHVFHIRADKTPATETREPFIMRDSSATNVDGAVYRIGPDTVYDTPVTVWLPVPADVAAGSLDIYYLSESPEHVGWYSADGVIGWMVPGSRKTVVENGLTYIEIQVNHGGLARLAEPERPRSGAAHIGLIGGLAAVLLVMGTRRKHL
ncbi:MAG: hypothetical protein QG656_1531, partial [Candidatus Hydrogenedentes bacterium]|nr:hypothetical protein [Candidatus Hydrogenedentota bacterium]